MNNEQPIIVGLDIGTTKIAVIAGRKNEFNKLEILGFGRANSNGVKHGQVLNIDETIKAIKTALENCYASNPNLEVNEVYVGIAGHHIKSLQTRGDIVRQETSDQITQKEIDHRSLEFGALSFVYRKAGAGDLNAQFEVDYVVFLNKFPVRQSVFAQFGDFSVLVHL